MDTDETLACDYTRAPRLLALESAAAECGAALYLAGECREHRAPPGTRPGEQLLTLVDALLADAGIPLTRLDAIAFDRGPGSFTGLRIAAGAAQGLALGVGVPVIAVSSLAALAQNAQVPKVLAALDARMGEVYWGAFRHDGKKMRLQGEERVVAPERVPLPGDAGWCGVGSGFAVHGTALRARLGAQLADTRPALNPTAAAIAQLAVEHYRRGACLDAADALPVYLRPAVAD